MKVEGCRRPFGRPKLLVWSEIDENRGSAGATHLRAVSTANSLGIAVSISKRVRGLSVVGRRVRGGHRTSGAGRGLGLSCDGSSSGCGGRGGLNGLDDGRRGSDTGGETWSTQEECQSKDVPCDETDRTYPWEMDLDGKEEMEFGVKVANGSSLTGQALRNSGRTRSFLPFRSSHLPGRYSSSESSR